MYDKQYIDLISRFFGHVQVVKVTCLVSCVEDGCTIEHHLALMGFHHRELR